MSEFPMPTVNKSNQIDDWCGLLRRSRHLPRDDSASAASPRLLPRAAAACCCARSNTVRPPGRLVGHCRFSSLSRCLNWNDRIVQKGAVD